MLPWNPVSLAVSQHLNEKRALSLHNYPTGSHTRGLSCIHFVIYCQEQEFYSFSLGKEFLQTQEENHCLSSLKIA